MDFHLDHGIRLSEESEYKRLYSWSLQEFSSDGTKVGSDQIPWEWGLDFSASELRYNRSLRIEKENESGEGGGRYRIPHESESITAILHPGVCEDGKSLERDTVFSMFGVKRAIEDFALRIYKLEDAQAKERCHLWACVSYTSEMDFRDETMPDTVQISAWVSPEKFYAICEKLAGNEIDVFHVRLKGVSGFYSEWSPSVSTSRVKVLASGKEQSVVLPDGCEISPPRVGEVEEFELSLVQRRKLNLKQDMAPDNIDKIFDDEDSDPYDLPEESEPKNKPDTSALILSQLLSNERAISDLSKPLWAIFVLILMVLIFK